MSFFANCYNKNVNNLLTNTKNATNLAVNVTFFLEYDSQVADI